MNHVKPNAHKLWLYTKDHALQLNFYRAHLLYFIFSILVASAIFWGSDTDGHNVTYTDALFMCASAMTNCGLTSIDLSTVNAYQQSLLFVLMALGDLSIASISVVWVRRYFFGKKIHNLLKTSKAARKLAEDIEEQCKLQHAKDSAQAKESSSSALSLSRNNTSSAESNAKPPHSTNQKLATKNIIIQRRLGVHSGYGGLPAPWETGLFRRLTDTKLKSPTPPRPQNHQYLTFLPELDNRGRFTNLRREQLEELGGIEYRALSVLIWLLPAYVMCWLCFSWVVLIPWTTNKDLAETIRTVQPGNTNPQWWAFFVGLSSYTNTGLSLLDQNMIPLRNDYLILIISGAVVLAGNTLYPILLRLLIWTLSKLVPRDSKLQHSLKFLLHHPRRCFLFLFPAKHTWYLFGIQILIFLVIWLGFEVLNIGYTPAEQAFDSLGQRVFDGLYQITGLRSSGLYILNQNLLSPGCQILFMVNMYISAIPFILSLRSSNIYEERSIGVMSDDEKDPDRNVSKSIRSKDHPSLQTHLRNQLAYDLWWIILAVWLVSIIERDNLADPDPDYSLFSVLFEVVSAYGTVGLSLGFPGVNTSFCGQWKTLSKLILITVMLRGRHRILPLAVDRAVLVPGQKLMEKLDQEEMLGPGEDRTAVLKRYEKEMAGVEEEEIAKAQNTYGYEKAEADENDEVSQERNISRIEQAAFPRHQSSSSSVTAKNR